MYVFAFFFHLSVSLPLYTASLQGMRGVVPGEMGDSPPAGMACSAVADRKGFMLSSVAAAQQQQQQSAAHQQQPHPIHQASY